MTELRTAIDSNDTEKINAAAEALQQASYKLSQLLYEKSSQAQAEQQPEGPTPESEGTQGAEEGEVIDAEFKEE